MNAKKQINSWNLILDMWDTHLNNPKYANDLSEIKINSQNFQTVEVVTVSHSFILNNLKKLLTIDPSLFGEVKDTKIGLEEFTKNTISKKFALPKRPKQFQQRKVIQKNKPKYKDDKYPHVPADSSEKSKEASAGQGENISNLLPFSQKVEQAKENNAHQEVENKFSPYKNMMKLFAVLLPLILLTFVIKNTFLDTDKEVKKQARTTEKDRKRNNVKKKRKTSSRRKANLKKSTNFKKKVNRRLGTSAKKQISKKSKQRRKNLLEQRTRKMPASLSTSQEEDINDPGTLSEDPYEQELLIDQRGDDESTINSNNENAYVEDSKRIEQDEMITEDSPEEESYQEEYGENDEDTKLIESPDTKYMQ